MPTLHYRAFVADHLPEGDHSGIIKSVGFYAAQQYAKSLSFAVARGMMSSIEQGRSAHCLRPPYGVDRLYVSLDGTHLHIIRNLSDGTQVKLHPETQHVLQTFEDGHYRIQANERVVLVPGEASRVEVVRQMFRLGGLQTGRSPDDRTIDGQSESNHVLLRPSRFYRPDPR